MTEPTPTPSPEQIAALKQQMTDVDKQIVAEADESLFDIQKQVDDLKARLAAEESRTRPVSRFLAGLRSRLPGLPSVSLPSIAFLADVGWRVWVTLALVGTAISLPTFSGCSLPTPFTPSPLGEGNKLVVFYDASSRMDPETQSALWSEEVWRVAGANLAVGPDGTAEARIFDIDADLSNERPIWQEVQKHAKGKSLPYAVVAGKKANFDGPLPKGKTGMVAELQRCFGGAKLPVMARPPPSDYVLTDANTKDAKEHATGLATNRKPTPAAMLAAFDLPEMTDAEIEAAIIRKNADKSWLDDVRNRGMRGQPIPSRDQNGRGYCWAHSSVSATLLVRAMNNQPYSDLSAYAVACIIKGYRDEGGWNSESIDFIATRGVPSATFWPQKSVSRTCDNAATWEDAKKHRITEWIKPTTRRQFATCLCNNIPVASDYSWWSHSVCGVRILSWGPNGSNMRVRLWNSWGDSYAANGMGDLEVSKSMPDADGMSAPRVTVASFAAKKQDGPLYAQAP